MAQNARPTLLVFTLGPGREQARKRWLPGRFGSVERALHEQCLQSVLEAGREVGCRLRVSTPQGRRLAPDAAIDRQDGEGFAARLLGAIERASDQSSGPLVVVGTDTPSLDAAIVRRALGALERNPDEVVLGPASDGGIYLLAAARPVGQELSAVRWQRRTTLDSLVAALRRAGRPVRLLAPLHDLDDRRDLERWLGRARQLTGTAWHDVAARLRRALAELSRLVPRMPARPPEPAWLRVRVGRAPPR